MNKHELHIEALLDKLYEASNSKLLLEISNNALCELNDKVADKLKEANATIAELEEKLNAHSGFVGNKTYRDEIGGTEQVPVNNSDGTVTYVTRSIEQPTFKFKKGDKVRCVGNGEEYEVENVYKTEGVVNVCLYRMIGDCPITSDIPFKESDLELIEDSK